MVADPTFPYPAADRPTDLVIHFTVEEQHVDVTYECGIEEETLGFVFGVNPENQIALTASEVTKLAQRVDVSRVWLATESPTPCKC